MNAFPETKGRLLAKLLRELLAGERFECLADLTEALKCRCARLHIRYTNDDIDDAYRLVSSNRPLLAPPAPRSTSTTTPELYTSAPISRADAAEILARIYQRLGMVSR